VSHIVNKYSTHQPTIPKSVQGTIIVELTKPWSYSALTAFETCPKRYQLTRVTKEVVERPSEAMRWGNKVHKALEMFAKTEQPLPPEMKEYGRYVTKILSYEGKRVIEERVALTKSFLPTTWMAKNVWVRGIIDIGVVGSDTAYLLDWKTGKHRPDNDQLKLFAALAFAKYPWVNKVVTGFIFLKAEKFEKEKFTRSQLPEIWSEFMPRLSRLATATADDKWLPKPSGLCKNWCPVGSSLCEHCGV
jgi:CRISPR/Cas system-associated exonuclease Cas4 (RecB family)